MSGIKVWLRVVLPLALLAAHNDFWLWSDSGLAWGLPVGLTYHLLYTAVTVVAMALLVRFAWPDELEDDRDGGR
mgnify:CR=1 FL=1